VSFSLIDEMTKVVDFLIFVTYILNDLMSKMLKCCFNNLYKNRSYKHRSLA
jgi:hypothetical protein